jgi:hypothetical protein
MNKHDPIPDVSFKLENRDVFWQEKADEYFRLSEVSKDNPQMAAAFAALSGSYAAAVAGMKVLEVTEVRAKKPSKPRRAVDIDAKRATAKRLGIGRRIAKCHALALSAPDDRAQKRLQTLIADLERQLGSAST